MVIRPIFGLFYEFMDIRKIAKMNLWISIKWFDAEFMDIRKIGFHGDF